MRKPCDLVFPFTLICRNYSTKTYRPLTCFRLRCDSLLELWKALRWLNKAHEDRDYQLPTVRMTFISVAYAKIRGSMNCCRIGSDSKELPQKGTRGYFLVRIAPFSGALNEIGKASSPRNLYLGATAETQVQHANINPKCDATMC